MSDKDIHPDWLKLPPMEARGDWPMTPRKVASGEPLVAPTNRPWRRMPSHSQRVITYGQYMVQLGHAQREMQKIIDKTLADNPGWQLLPSGQFVDADGNDVGMWID